MAVCHVASRMSVAPTAARGPSLYATTAVTPQILEIGVSNTTVTSAAIGVAIASATGTQGAGLTEVATSDRATAIIATAFNTHTADATVGGAVVQWTLGAAIGAGIVWRWAPGEFQLSAATTSGVVIICPTGTGQICDFWIKWIE